MANKSGVRGEQTKRVFLPLTQEEIYAIDDWGFNRRIRARSEVLRALVHAGLRFGEKATAAEQKV